MSTNTIIAKKPKVNQQIFSDAKLATMRTLRSLSALPLDDSTIMQTMRIPSMHLLEPRAKTMAMIIFYYNNICENGPQTAFSLSSATLFEQVKNINMLPKNLGFYYDEVLRRECELIIPKAIDENSFLEQLMIPIQLWRSNFQHLQCPLLGTALVLSLIHRFIRQEKNLANVDWTPLINILVHAPLGELAAWINETIIVMLEKAKNEAK